MRRFLIIIATCFHCVCSFALTESEGISFVKNYYKLLTEYASAENVYIAKKIEAMHLGNGHVYPDVEINLGKGMTETESVGIKSVYLVSIVARQNLLLKFVPSEIIIESNTNGICAIAYTLSVYSGNESPGRDVLKYSIPLRMEIQNADKKIKSILKRDSSAPPQTTLIVNPSRLTFDAQGGSKILTVNSNNSWSISVNPDESWVHLTRSGNTLTLQVDAYTGAIERTDYFKIKAGNKEERVNITQAANVASLSKSAIIHSVTVENNIDVNGTKGLSVKVSFNIIGMKGKEGKVSCYFYDTNGNALIDRNNSYCTNETPPHVAVSRTIQPGYDNSKYTDFEVSIPYDELHLASSVNTELRVDVLIWDNSVSPYKSLTRKENTRFTCIPYVSYLKVDGSSSDKTKYFGESGGRETYSISTSASSYETWGVPSWCRIEDKTSTSFTLVCLPNETSSERSDYMKVKADGKEVRIDIKQDGRSEEAVVENCWLEHNLTRTFWNGYMWTNVNYMRIHCRFSVEGHKDEKIKVCAFFYFSNGNTVNAVNGEFRAPDGQATVQGYGNCTYDDAIWKDYTLDIPYYALPSGSLYVVVQILDKNGNFLAESSNISFSVVH